MEKQERKTNKKLAFSIAGGLVFVCGILAAIFYFNRPASLVGKWVGSESGFFYEFFEDGTGRFGFGEVGAQDFSYSEENGKIKIRRDDRNDEVEMEYKIERNKLTIQDGFGKDIIYVGK